MASSHRVTEWRWIGHFFRNVQPLTPHLMSPPPLPLTNAPSAATDGAFCFLPGSSVSIAEKLGLMVGRLGARKLLRVVCWVDRRALLKNWD